MNTTRRFQHTFSCTVFTCKTGSPDKPPSNMNSDFLYIFPLLGRISVHIVALEFPRSVHYYQSFEIKRKDFARLYLMVALLAHDCFQFLERNTKIRPLIDLSVSRSAGRSVGWLVGPSVRPSVGRSLVRHKYKGQASTSISFFSISLCSIVL